MAETEIIKSADNKDVRKLERYMFKAEIKQSAQNKAVSNDNIYRLVLITEDPIIMEIGKISPEKLVKVMLEVDND